MSTDKQKIEKGITGRGLDPYDKAKNVFSQMCAPSLPLAAAVSRCC